MGAVLGRALRNFNVESRAHKLIGKDTPRPAPMHPNTMEAVSGLLSRHPEIKENLYKKDDKLLSRLKDVYVDSIDPLPEVKHQDLAATSEEFRVPKQTMASAFLNLDVDRIPQGKVTIVEAMTILTNHKQSPQTWTAQRIAEDYRLNIQDAEALLRYFRPFNVEIIAEKNNEQIEDK